MSAIGSVIGIPFTTIRGTRIGQYLLYNDGGAVTWRKGVRGGYFVLDKTLDATGFAGVEDVNWENVKSVLGGNTVTDFDGNVYITVTIGTQTWMAENLKTTHYVDGTVIPNVTVQLDWDADTTGAYCWYDNDEVTYGDRGILYNWYSVDHASVLAPTGWHIPTNADWVTLDTYLGGGWVSGGKMREDGTVHWTAPNAGATNSSGFTALPGGYRTDAFYNPDTTTYFWSATETDLTIATCYLTDNLNANLTNADNFDKYMGCSVRCVKD